MTESAQPGKGILLLLLTAWIMAGSFLKAIPVPENANLRPSLQHPLGCSPYGQDLALWCITASAKTAIPSLFATVATLVVGTIVGCLAAELRKKHILYWAFKTCSNLLDGLGPLLIIGCLLSALPTIEPAILSILLATVSWPVVSTVAYSETLEIRKIPYVQAVVALGATPTYLIIKYFIPIMWSRLVPLCFGLFAGFFGIFGALGFLGLGTNNEVNLGFLIFDSQNYLRSNPRYFESVFLFFVGMLATCALMINFYKRQGEH